MEGGWYGFCKPLTDIMISLLAGAFTDLQTRASFALCEPTCRHTHQSSSSSPSPVQPAAVHHVQSYAVHHRHPAVASQIQPAVVHPGHDGVVPPRPPAAVHPVQVAGTSHVQPDAAHHGPPAAASRVYPAAVHRVQRDGQLPGRPAGASRVQPARASNVLLAAVHHVQPHSRLLDTTACLARPSLLNSFHASATPPKQCRCFSALATAAVPEGPGPSVPQPWGLDAARDHEGKKVACDAGYSSPIVLEARALAPQADGSCLLRCGDVQLLATAVCDTAEGSGRPGDRAGHVKRQDRRRLRVSGSVLA